MTIIFDNFFNKITSEDARLKAFYTLIVLSAVNVIYFVIKIFYIHRTLNIVILLLLLYFLLVRIYKLKFNFTSDEKIVFALTFFSILPAFTNSNYHKMNFIVPISFCSMYIGLSSFIKMTKIDLKFLKKILNLFLILTAIHLVVAFIGLMLPKDLPFFGKWVNLMTNGNTMFLSGLYRNPNHFSNGLMVGVACSFTFIIINYLNGKNRVLFYYLMLFIFIYGIILSASRAVLLASFLYLFFTIIYSLIIRKSKFINTKNLTVFIVSIPILIFILYISDSFDGLLLKRFKHSGRMQFWPAFIKYQFDLFPDIIFFFGRSFKGIINSQWNNPIFKYTLHSIFLSTWAKYGLFTLLLLIALLFNLFKNIFKKKTFWFLFFIPAAFIFRDIFDEKWLSVPLWIESFFITLMFLIPYNSGSIIIENNNNNL